MNDDNHETQDEYEDRKEQHEAASEIDAFRASCTHIRVIYRPVGGNAEGWRPVWVCERCCAEFVPESQVNMAFRAADLRGAQLLMVGSQLADDPKMDHRDRADPRWTPTLHEAWVAVQSRKENAAQIVALMYERDGWKEHSAALVADLEEMRKRESSLSEQLRIMNGAYARRQSAKKVWGCASCRHASQSVADNPCDGCEQAGGDKGSLWEPLESGNV
jgi:hypothetical protein